MQTSIIVSRDNMPTMVDLNCMFCKAKFLKTNREVLIIWMGEAYPARQIPLAMAWAQHKCRGCGHIYNIYFQ